MYEACLVTTAPAVEPVTLEEAKAFLRLEIPDDDAIVSSLITAARLHCETRLRQALITQQLLYISDQFPWGGGYWNRAVRQMGPSPYWLPSNTGIIHLPRPPLQSIQSLTYRDFNNVFQTIDANNYTFSPFVPGNPNPAPARIQPMYGQVWPVAMPHNDSIQIHYTAGYGDSGAEVPENIKTAIKMMVVHWYERRAPIDEVNLVPVPDAVDALLAISDHGAYA